MELDRRSLESLDWPFVLEALAAHARTDRGRLLARGLRPADSANAVRRLLDAVDEVATLREERSDGIPLGGIVDVAALLSRAAKGETLEPAELREVAATVTALADLCSYFDRHCDSAPILAGRAGAIRVDPRLRKTLQAAFDERGELSDRAYPRLAELRRRIAALERRVRATLERLLASTEMADLLQDRYVTLSHDRFVVPIKAHARTVELGIVHETSRSGRTVFVEPHQVVALNNERCLAEAELANEQLRILRELSVLVGTHAGALNEGLDAATEIDLACAREAFARRLAAVRPEIGDRGIIRLRGARHPVLLLRGSDVVANDLVVDERHPVLVLSGPNAGGKTVALKTVGLCALLVGVGCFVPAEPGSRVDVFAGVLADIGDQQTVHHDLSSFSAHLTTLHTMLERAGSGVLLLLDELAAGTDPAQGGALARALIERFADLGACVVATTHYAQVKSMAASDERVTIAAMEYQDERPTYRVMPGMAGESHALSAAVHAGIDQVLVDRARALMDEGERALADALATLERERARSHELARHAEEAARTLGAREASLAKREAELRGNAKRLEQEAAAGFVERLRAAEREIARVVAELQKKPGPRAAQAARRAVQELAGALPPEEQGAVPRADELVVGTRVRVRKLDVEGEVIAVTDRDIEVQAGSMTLRLRPGEIEQISAAGASEARGRAGAASVRHHRNRTSRPARSSTRSAPGRARAAAPTPGPETLVRLPSNTLDLRGQRVEAGLEMLERFLDAAVLHGEEGVFVLHGHGTGAMKEAVRRALTQSPYVAACAPAAAEQGGDAFTVVVLRG